MCCYVGCLAVVVRVCCGVVVLRCVMLCACDECWTPVVGCATVVGFVFGGARLYCSVVLLDGGPELVVSMISVSGLVSWVKWSLELNGLKRLLVSGAFGLWCRRVSNAFGLWS